VVKIQKWEGAEGRGVKGEGERVSEVAKEIPRTLYV
jgi:hypothetical protein